MEGVRERLSLFMVTSLCPELSVEHSPSYSSRCFNSEMGRIKDRSGSEQFKERIGAENSQGCSAPLRGGAAVCDPQEQEALLCSVTRSAKNQSEDLLNSENEPLCWIFCLKLSKK